jgi:hypothetical protein
MQSVAMRVAVTRVAASTPRGGRGRGNKRRQCQRSQADGASNTAAGEDPRPSFVPKFSQNTNGGSARIHRLAWSVATFLVALERFWSNKLWPEKQHVTSAADVNAGRWAPAPQRRRITGHLCADVVEHYRRGMSSRRVAATLGLRRTTVLGIPKSAGVDIRPQGPKY